MEKKLFNDINVYNVNAEKRNGAGRRRQQKNSIA